MTQIGIRNVFNVAQFDYDVLKTDSIIFLILHGSLYSYQLTE